MSAAQLPVTTYYEEDHDRLDRLFREFQRYKRSDFAKAKQFFREFKTGLQRHIIWEEEILFPQFEEKTGNAQGPTAVMRMEHRLIGRYLEMIHEKVRAGDPASDKEEEEMMALLGQHNLKEENILYPAIDRHLRSEEVEAVFASMKALPEERYHTCCHNHEGTTK